MPTTQILFSGTYNLTIIVILDTAILKTFDLVNFYLVAVTAGSLSQYVEAYWWNGMDISGLSYMTCRRHQDGYPGAFYYRLLQVQSPINVFATATNFHS